MDMLLVGKTVMKKFQNSCLLFVRLHDLTVNDWNKFKFCLHSACDLQKGVFL